MTTATTTPMQQSEELKIDSVIEQTRQEIHANEEVKNKKRGRPSGSKKVQSQPLVNASPEVQKMSIESYKMMVGGILDLSGLYLNKASESNIFTLEKEEKEVISTQGAECMMEFMPVIESKYMKLAGFTIVLASIYGMRYTQFVELNNKRQKEKKTVEVKNEVQTNG